MIIVFDAQCLLCNAGVQFLLRHDRRAALRFAAIQSVTGRRLLMNAGLNPNDLSTLLVVDGTRSWRYTAAILRICHTLGGPWRLAWLAWLIPAPLRDALYRGLARKRYRLFGRANTCLAPPADAAERFLE